MSGGAVETGPVAVITGAASGIGRAAVELFTGRGAKVVAVDLSADGLAWTADRADVVTVAGDVSAPAVNAAMAQAAMDTWGRLDWAFLNAGVVGAPGIEDDGAADRLDQIMAVNVRGVMLGIRHCAPAMRAGGGGAVVATASTSGLRADPGNWAYNASKAAVVNLVRAAAIEYATHNIRVNAVAPGPTITGMTKGLEAAPQVKADMTRRIPMQRWGGAHEQAQVAWFLCSSDASFVTGVTIPCDGGISANAGHFLPAAEPFGMRG
jgi:meso-butanediol dehydrogenase / (S,S)-butanediol dehydrogenase / diacetyl reductase